MTRKLESPVPFETGPSLDGSGVLDPTWQGRHQERWLFELAQMGPRLKPSIAALYWVALIFLAALVLSVSLIAVQVIVEFAELVANATGLSFVHGDLHTLVYVFLIAIVVTALLAPLAAIGKRARTLSAILVGIAVVAIAVFFLESQNEERAETLTELFLPTVVAAGVIKVTMGRWGLAGLVVVLGLSYAAAAIVAQFFGWGTVFQHMPWSINSFWSSIASYYFIALYLAIYAAFLQPYLGDAARYFRNSPGNVAVRREIRRQAVSTLQNLHLSGKYDRILIIAHSLGAVIAYDMLRAYYSRVKDALPDLNLLGVDFEAVDRGNLKKSEARASGRKIVNCMARALSDAEAKAPSNRDGLGDEKTKAWLVTDFITLGSPLTHSLYLMCRGRTEHELQTDFARHVRERDFPTCPPRMLDGDGRLTFKNPKTGKREFHHGGMFALTRWTNLYFPASELFWGDAIGGELGSLFGDPSGSNIADVPVYANTSNRRRFSPTFSIGAISDSKQPRHISRH
jgi:hypothetical protein